MSTLQTIKEMHPGQALISITAFGRLIGFHPTSIRPMIGRGQVAIETVKIGARRLVPVEAAAAFIDARRQPAKPKQPK